MDTHESLRGKTIEDIIVDALNTDGSHHKQWYLDQLLRKVIAEKEYKRLSMDSEYGGWDLGIIP